MFEGWCSNARFYIESSFRFITILCSSEWLVTIPSHRGTSFCSEGLVRKPISFSFSQPAVILQASTRTIVPMVLEFRQTELLVCKGAVGRALVTATWNLSLGAVRPPTSCEHLRAVPRTSLRDDQRGGKSGSNRPCAARG